MKIKVTKLITIGDKDYEYELYSHKIYLHFKQKHSDLKSVDFEGMCLNGTYEFVVNTQDKVSYTHTLNEKEMKEIIC